jgi:sterol desaturase/sphingolipid hydroxylase (fatty acid hydroxylase superfamily)
MMPASDVSPKMFDHPFVDFFSRTHWLAVPAVYLPLVAWSVYQSQLAGAAALTIVGAFAAGLLIWSLTEYWLHRTLFHWEPQTWWGPRFHFIAHGVHHTYHRDPYRLVMPPAVSAVLAVLFYAMFSGLGLLFSFAFSPAWSLAAYGGFVLGYITYDCTHYILHHWKPRGSIMKRLRAHHMNHHHNDPDRKFGVSSTLWDRVFGTM